ncbi:MAG: hypothetical protein HQ506_06790 [Candidatus Marinimicrobia bacterium]|nr:hypothetical protein [Candidatus Neomarinimicrobiota bacterium]
MEMSLSQYRTIALMSLWIGLIVTVGMVFALIPNVELIILSAFLGGVALGPRRGLIVAIVGEAIFSAFNPIGSGLGFPVLYAFQIISIGLSGLTGGLLSMVFVRKRPYPTVAVLLGFIGFLLTLIYDTLTALSFPISSGLAEGTIWVTLSLGVIFFVAHLVSNTIIFSLFGPGLVNLVLRQLEMHGLLRGQHAS